MVAELKDTMASKYFPPPALLKDNAGRRQGYKNKTCSTNKKKLNPRDRTGNITVCFNCGCRFHWSYDCPYGHSSRNKDGVEIEEDLSICTWS